MERWNERGKDGKMERDREREMAAESKTERDGEISRERHATNLFLSDGASVSFAWEWHWA